MGTGRIEHLDPAHKESTMNSRDYVYELFGCTGRKAIVTGASSGLGAEMARILARAGADVLFVARRSEKLQSLAAEMAEAEGSMHICAADLSSNDGIERVGIEAERTLGGCDILVANAGSGTRAPLHRMEETEFNDILHLNTTAQWQLSKRLFELLKASASGRVINIASVYGVGASVIHGLGAYTTSKHALVGLTKSQAAEWGRYGITANAIAPGYFPTELTETALADEAMSARLRGFTPHDRFGDPAELAPALLFLASRASAYVTGAIVPVDGGWTAW